MTKRASELDLIALAVTGDEQAVTHLLWSCHDRLSAHIARGLTRALRRDVDAEDILQEVLTDAWLHIRGFKPQGSHSFYPWIKTIADRRLIDKVRAQGAKKRGVRAVARSGDGSTDFVATLLELTACDEHSPSSLVARREAERALHVALAGLKEDYQQVLRLRYLEGLPVAAVATQLDRTDGAVQMLCNRAIKKLQEAMGRVSKYFGNK